MTMKRIRMEIEGLREASMRPEAERPASARVELMSRLDLLAGRMAEVEPAPQDWRGLDDFWRSKFGTDLTVVLDECVTIGVQR